MHYSNIIYIRTAFYRTIMDVQGKVDQNLDINKIMTKTVLLSNLKIDIMRNLLQKNNNKKSHYVTLIWR